MATRKLNLRNWLYHQNHKEKPLSDGERRLVRIENSLSMLARRIPDAINGVLTGVFRVSGRLVCCSLGLIKFAFRLKMLVAYSMPSCFFGFADNLVCCAFYMFLIHDVHLMTHRMLLQRLASENNLFCISYNTEQGWTM